MSNFYIRPIMERLSALKPQISVIVSAYGDMPRRSIRKTMASVMNQTDIRKEIVLSEQYREERLYESLCCEFECPYVAEKLESINDWNPGAVRNTGAICSRGDYIVFLDADMVFVKDGVLRQIYDIVSVKDNRFLAGPRVLRISERLYERLQPNWEDSSIFLQELIKRSDLGIKRSGYWLDINPSDVIVQTVHNGKEYIAMEKNAKIFSLDPAQFKGIEATVWHPVRHWGTIFISRELFKMLGGYCEGFVNWGCEDTDLLQKMKAVGYEIPFSTLDDWFAHIEHSHAHVRRSLSFANGRLANEREGQWRRSISTDRATLHNREVRLLQFGVQEELR